ncbi:MAG: helix-turn-helix transcriptional regulator [Clostridiales bacterium]|jgi:DNA-binding Xre family transcriptional regulator|nr:helix-turn-helix transcriptional regulator [Clostridiales bacterium]
MVVSYNKLWKLLIDRKMSKAGIRKLTNISPNTITKMNKNEYMALSILDKMCNELDCDFGDIVEHIKENENI